MSPQMARVFPSGETIKMLPQLDRLGLVYVPVRDELAQVLVEINHAFEHADADGVRQLLVLALDDQLADRGIHDHDLIGWNALDARLEAGQQLLTNDCF